MGGSWQIDPVDSLRIKSGRNGVRANTRRDSGTQESRLTDRADVWPMGLRSEAPTVAT